MFTSFFLSVSMIATRTLIYLPNTLYLFSFLVSRSYISHCSSRLTVQTSRRRYSLVHERSRGCDARARW